VFKDATSPSGITINAGDEGPSGCECWGQYCQYPSPGYCMDVILTTTDPIIDMGVSVSYDSDNGLAVLDMREWMGVGVSFNKQGTPQKSCAPAGGLADNDETIQSFDCIIAPPSNPPVMPAGTYKIGSITWDTSGTTLGTEVIRAVFASGDGVTAVINGNVVDVTSSVVVRSHILNIIGDPTPVPSMSATGITVLGVGVFGIGVVGLVIAARRRRPPQQ